MKELQYFTLVWLSYRLAATFAFGLPLTLLIWAAVKKETAIVKLMSIYWKVSSLMAISMLFLTNQNAIGYLTFFITPFLMVISLWFWVDLNEELDNLPPWRPLPLTIRIWRWALSCFAITWGTMSFTSLDCMDTLKGSTCSSWLQEPQNLHQITEKIFSFLFGANWNEPMAEFIGYVALVIYTLGFLQWLLIRLPKDGRIAGNF